MDCKITNMSDQRVNGTRGRNFGKYWWGNPQMARSRSGLTLDCQRHLKYWHEVLVRKSYNLVLEREKISALGDVKDLTSSWPPSWQRERPIELGKLWAMGWKKTGALGMISTNFIYFDMDDRIERSKAGSKNHLIVDIGFGWNKLILFWIVIKIKTSIQ